MSAVSIENRNLTTELPFENELRFEPNQNYAFPLDYLGYISIIGNNAGTFFTRSIDVQYRGN